jgi:3-polyprenyl-4-hydroxybenzoate decarboxylase
VDFVVGRLCDQFGIENRLLERWGDQEGGTTKAETGR